MTVPADETTPPIEGAPPAETQPPETPPGETPPAETPPAEAPPAEEPPKEAPTELDMSAFKFQGQEVTVTVPDDLREELTAKGVDVNKVVTELYTSEDFTVSDETKQALYGVYGKAIVDSYLDALKTQNEATLKGAADTVAQQEAAEAAVWTETLEQIGGEPVWSAMEAFAQKTFSDEEFLEFNRVMSQGTRYAQKLAISDVLNRYKAAEGDAAPTLVKGDAVPPAAGTEALSYAEYQALFKSGEYSKNPKLYDAMRRRGQARGI